MLQNSTSYRRSSVMTGVAAGALMAFGLAACGGDSGTGPPGNGGGGGGSASVTVSPVTATLEALEATVNLSASGTSSEGNQVTDAEMDWRSTDAGVATVDDLGMVTARGEGSAMIVVALADGAAADTAAITVDQAVTETRIQPMGAELPALGDTVHLSASPVDANGFPVEDVTITWASTDSSVLTVDGDGVATAVDTGEAQVVAMPSEGPEGRITVEVAQPDPAVDAVSPDTLREGAAAVVTGRNFSTDPNRNTVLVDGIPAAVTSASATRLDIQVPQFDCRPLRGAGLRVAVGDDTSSAATVTVGPDESTASLAVGERLLIQDPGDDFCLQLGASGQSQEYLVGVQAVTDAVGPVTARLALEAGGSAGGGGASTAPTASGASTDAFRSGGDASRTGGVSTGGLAPSTAGPLDGPAGRSAVEARLRAWERAHLAPRMNASIPRRWGGGGPPAEETTAALSVATRVGSNPAEGDTVDIRVPDVVSSDPCANFTPIRAVIRKVGTHGIWLEDVDNPSGGFDASTWQELSDKFDDHIHPTDTEYFGDPTDIDGNGRSAIVVTKELNALGGILGFVFAGDLFSRSGSGTTCSSSDEGELTYTIAPDPNGTVGDTVETESQRRSYPNLIAHEFTHILQFGQRFQCSSCDFPVTWILEGQATLAEEVVGHAVTGRQTGQNYGFDVAFNSSEADFTDWYRDRWVDQAVYHGFQSQSIQISSAPESCSWLARDWAGPCRGNRGVYGVPSLILRWINDHLGPGYPGGEAALQRDLTANDDAGFANVEEVTGESMASLLADWGPMLWVDDRVPGVPARLTLPSWDITDIFSGLVSTARLAPKTRSFADFSDSFAVNAGSAAYYLVGGGSRPPVAIRARRLDGTPLPPLMQFWVVRTQ